MRPVPDPRGLFVGHKRYYPAVRDSSEDRLPLRYQSGEEIIKGDHVLLSGEPGVIEMVADPEVSDPSTEWYVQEFGGGVMISKLQRLGSVFTGDPASDSDLQFICRSETEADASQN